MFFIKYLQREISIHPSFFGKDMEDRLKERLYADMEGSCNGEYYIICVLDVSHISAGRIKPGRGDANFVIDYRAIVWKPFRGETVGGIRGQAKEVLTGCSLTAQSRTSRIKEFSAMLVHSRSSFPNYISLQI